MNSSRPGRDIRGARKARWAGQLATGGLAVAAVAFLGGCAAGTGGTLGAGEPAVTRDDIVRLQQRLQAVEQRQQGVRAELDRITREPPDAPAGPDAAQARRWEEMAAALAAVTKQLEGLQADLLGRLARIEERQQNARAELTHLARELSEERRQPGSTPGRWEAIDRSLADLTTRAEQLQTELRAATPGSDLERLSASVDALVARLQQLSTRLDARERAPSAAGVASGTPPGPASPGVPVAQGVAPAPEAGAAQTSPSAPVAGTPSLPTVEPSASPDVAARSATPGGGPPAPAIAGDSGGPGAKPSTSSRIVEGAPAPGVEPAPPVAEGQGPPAAGPTSAPPVAMVPGASAVEPRAGTERRPRDLYEAAYVDFSRGNYALAIGGFREFLRQHPDHSVADNAQYWIGEAYLRLAYRYENEEQVERAKQALQEAVQAFRRVAERYPTGDKVASAVYREALVLLELKESEKARDRLEYLIAHFPSAPETRAAREWLAQLGER